MDALFTFITMTFPKAGIQIAGLPLTLNLLLTAYVVLRHPNQTLLMIQRHKNFAILYVVLLFFGIITILTDIAQGARPYFLAQILIVLISPAVGISASRISSDRFIKIVIIAMIITNAYGIAQYFIGISQLAIPGISYTYGQDFLNKAIGWNADTNTAEKIVSTYQTGNSFGIFSVLSISYLLSHRLRPSSWKYARYIALILGFVGFLLCGSRSIQIPFFLFLFVLLIQFIRQIPPHRRGITLIGGGMVVAVGLAALAVQRTIISQFTDRLIKQTLSSSTGNGRTIQWAHNIDVISEMNGSELLRQILIGQDPNVAIGGEGLPKYFCIFGLISTVAFFGGIISVIRMCWHSYNGRTVAVGILCVFIAFCVDQSFLYPPNVMNIALFAVAVLCENNHACNKEGYYVKKTH